MVHKKRKKFVRNDDIEDDMEEDDIENIDMNAVTDSEEEYTEAEKKLLEKVRNKNTTENYDSEDEVYPLQNSEEEDDDDDEKDSMKSDIEEEQDDIPNIKAWGNKARNFYLSDFKYGDKPSSFLKDSAKAKVENEEGSQFNTMTRNTSHVKLDNIEFKSNDDNDDQKNNKQLKSKINKNFFMKLVNILKEYMTEIKDILEPFLKLVENGICPDCNAVDFVKTKYHVLLNYCINISFALMMLKAKKKFSITSHPVSKRLEQYGELLMQLQSREGNLMDQVVDIVEGFKKNKPIYTVSDDSQTEINKKLTSSRKKLAHQTEAVIKENRKRKAELISDNIDDSMDETDETDETDTNEEASSIEEKYDNDIEEKYDNDVEKKYKTMEVEKDNATLETNEDKKRAITYEMEKNRGLTPYRKKELRNPRVKYKNKYRKVTIRRKGAVREVRKEITRYAGERSGIKAGAKKGIKLK